MGLRPMLLDKNVSRPLTGSHKNQTLDWLYHEKTAAQKAILQENNSILIFWVAYTTVVV